MKIDDSIAILERTPNMLRVWLEGLPKEWIEWRIGPDAFSPFDVIGHLIHGERTDWIPRLRMILEHGTSRPFEPFDRFAMYDLSNGRSLASLLDEFAQLREANLKVLQSLKLSDADLKREGQHPALGRVTLSQLLATWVVHDLNHIDQIARTMAHRYRDDVGPWHAYLGVLSRG
jgi:hypothetical protein